MLGHSSAAQLTRPLIHSSLRTPFIPGASWSHRQPLARSVRATASRVCGHTPTFLSALMRSGWTLTLSLTTDTAVLGAMAAALLGAVEMMA